MVGEVTSLLHVYTSDLISDNLSQIDEIVQALVEMCVGNTPNQRVIFEKQVNEALNRLLGLPVIDSHESCSLKDTDQVMEWERERVSEEYLLCSIWPLLALRISYTVLNVQVFGGYSQREGKCCPTAWCNAWKYQLTDTRDSRSKHIHASLDHGLLLYLWMQGIGSTIDVQSLLDTMSFFCEFQVHPLMIMKEMDDDCQRGMYRSYHILLSLMECKAIEKIRKGSLNVLRNYCVQKN